MKKNGDSVPRPAHQQPLAERIRTYRNTHRQELRNRGLFLIGPLVNLFIVETLNERNPLTNLNFRELWMNLALYAVVWLAFWLVLGRRRRSAAAVSIFFFLAGLANHYVLKFKGSVLFPHDIVGAKTAVNVAKNYDFTPDLYVFGAFLILVAYLVLLKRKAEPQPRRSWLRPWWVNLLAVAAATCYCWAFFFSPWLEIANIRTVQWNTQNNGWVLNFSLALRYGRVEKPEGYSLDQVRSILEEHTDDGGSMTLYRDPNLSTPYDEATQEAEGAGVQTALEVHSNPEGVQPTNILCIMDESFADLSIFDRMCTDSDVIPYYRSLKENTIKGWMYSSTTGGGTANVEYEFLTSNSLSFLPVGTVPYQLYVKPKMPSIISWAKENGYRTTTFHPYKASGWNRVAVYKDFGADYQIYLDDMKQTHFVRRYISDRSDFRVLYRNTRVKKKTQRFIFNVTIQNHGGYAQTWRALQKTVELAGPMKDMSEEVHQYLCLMRETDRALGELIHYYSGQKEPALILFFGDHQGKLPDWFYSELYGKPLEERTMQEIEMQYAVPFFIWANYDIDEAEDVMISSNYLAPLVTLLSNRPTTPYYNYLTQLYQDLPVINRNGFIRPDGSAYGSKEELSEELQQKLREYQILSYYNLFQRDEALDQEFFLPKSSES